MHSCYTFYVLQINSPLEPPFPKLPDKPTKSPNKHNTNADPEDIPDEPIFDICLPRAETPLPPHLASLCSAIGQSIASLHHSSIIHGDLTTSNILVKPILTSETSTSSSSSSSSSSSPATTQLPDGSTMPIARPVFIDFGLSYISATSEDQAVDLYVLERAIAATHPTITGFVCLSLLPSKLVLSQPYLV